MPEVSLARVRQVANLARSVASTLDLDSVLRQVVEAVLSLRPGASCVVRLRDPERGGYRVAAMGGADVHGVASVIPFGSGMTHAVMQSGQPMLLPDAVGDPRLVAALWWSEHGLKVYYGVPISAGGDTMGVLNLGLPDSAQPTTEEREIVDLLASHAAVAIGNARLFAESETRRRTAEALAEVWRFLSETFDVAALSQRIADVVLRALRVRAAALYRLVPGSSGDLEVIGRSGEAERFLDPGFVIPAGHGVVGLAVDRRQPVVTPDIRVDSRVRARPGMRVGHALCPSVLSLPLVVKGRVVGGFTVGDVLGRVYTEEDLSLAQTFADQAAVALENARLFEETERRRRESAALGGVSQILAQSLHSGDVARRIVDCVRGLMGLLAASVYTADPESGLLEEIACAGRSPFQDRPPRNPRSSGAVALAVAERRAVVSNDVLTDPRLRYTEEARAVIERSLMRSVLAVPLMVKDQVIGALGLVDAAGRVFTTDDVQLAQAFADQAAVALENARLYAEAERRRVEAETLAGVVRTISATLDLDSVLRHVAAAAGELCASDIAHIVLRDADSDTMFHRYGVGYGSAGDWPHIERGKGAGGTAWATGRPFRTSDRLGDPRIGRDYADEVVREGIVTTVAVPIWIGGQVEGVLYVANRTPRPFSDRDEAILSRLADHAAIAIQNATLFSRLQGLSGRLMEVQEAERRHLARELHDEIGQLLTGLRLTLDVPEPPSASVRERLGQAQILVEELLDRIRALSLDLRPSILDDLGLLPALLGHVERYTSQTKIQVNLEHSGLDRRFPSETETAAYRIVQEALTNVARHGRVDEVTVRLWATDEILGVQVEDHGEGFDPRMVLGAGRSGGLAGLRERAALLNGHLTVETEPGRGVRLTAEVPLTGSIE